MSNNRRPTDDDMDSGDPVLDANDDIDESAWYDGWDRFKRWVSNGSGWKSRISSVWRFCKEEVAALVGLAGMLIAAAFIFQILFSPVQLGVVSDPNEVVVESSERLVQIVQWTITTILLVAGSLLGLNWYRDEKNYRRDRKDVRRAIKRLEAFRQDTESRMQEALDSMEERLMIMREESIQRVFEESVERVAEEVDPLAMFIVLLESYERLSLLEAPDNLRTGLLISEVMHFIAATDGDIMISRDEESEMEDTDLFFYWALQTFPSYERRLMALRERVKFE